MGRSIIKLIRNLSYLSRISLWEQREEDIRTRLKEITPLRNAVYGAKKIRRTIISLYRKFKSMYYLRKIRNKNTGCPILVGFIVQEQCGWDKQETLFDVLNKSESFKTYLFVVPREDFVTYEIQVDYTNNFFLNRYSNAIRAMNQDGTCIDLRKYELDYLFYPRPYDFRLPYPLRSYNTMKYTKCCYISYGFTASDAFDESNLYSEFYDFQYFLFMDSDYTRKKMASRCWNNIHRGIQHVEYLGYPSNDIYLKMSDVVHGGSVVWTPRWSFDETKGGSTFLKNKDSFLNMVQMFPDSYVFRAHPLIKQEVIRLGYMDSESWNSYIKELEGNNVIVDLETPINNILGRASILISDFSTIIGSFFLTGRPIIYCDDGIKLNDIYMEFLDYIYVAKEWDDVMVYYSKLKNGIDPKKKARLSYINSKYRNYKDSSVMITQRILKDAGREVKG